MKKTLDTRLLTIKTKTFFKILIFFNIFTNRLILPSTEIQQKASAGAGKEGKENQNHSKELATALLPIGVSLLSNQLANKSNQQNKPGLMSKLWNATGGNIWGGTKWAAKKIASAAKESSNIIKSGVVKGIELAKEHPKTAAAITVGGAGLTWFMIHLHNKKKKEEKQKELEEKKQNEQEEPKKSNPQEIKQEIKQEPKQELKNENESSNMNNVAQNKKVQSISKNFLKGKIGRKIIRNKSLRRNSIKIMKRYHSKNKSKRRTANLKNRTLYSLLM